MGVAEQSGATLVLLSQQQQQRRNDATINHGYQRGLRVNYNYILMIYVLL